MSTEFVEIYTDGACKGNPGPGGWGALLRYKGQEKELWGGELDTTNNRMELLAVIQALNSLKRPCAIHLYTDSQYVQKASASGFTAGRRGLETAAKEPVKTPTCGVFWTPPPANTKSTGAGSRATPVMSSTNGPTPWPIAAWKPRWPGAEPRQDMYALHHSRY